MSPSEWSVQGEGLPLSDSDIIVTLTNAGLIDVFFEHIGGRQRLYVVAPVAEEAGA